VVDVLMKCDDDDAFANAPFGKGVRAKADTSRGLDRGVRPTREQKAAAKRLRERIILVLIVRTNGLRLADAI